MSSSSGSNFNPVYLRMRDMTRDCWAQGLGAVETNEKIREKFGDQAPTQCTIYKWRREFRGGKGEREANLDDIEFLEGQQKGPKLSKKRAGQILYILLKRNEFAQLLRIAYAQVHDVFLGDTKPTMDLLDTFSPLRRRQLIFRCDACFGGELDYDTVEDLQQHKLLEHGHQMKMPKWSEKSGGQTITNGNFKVAIRNVIKHHQQPPQSSIKLPGSSQSNATLKSPKAQPGSGREFLGRDKSLPTVSTLRRSTRVPKPTSAMIKSFMLAKDFGLENEFEEEEVVDHCYPRKEPKYEPFEEEAEVKKRKEMASSQHPQARGRRVAFKQNSTGSSINSGGVNGTGTSTSSNTIYNSNTTTATAITQEKNQMESPEMNNNHEGGENKHHHIMNLRSNDEEQEEDTGTEKMDAVKEKQPNVEEDIATEPFVTILNAGGFRVEPEQSANVQPTMRNNTQNQKRMMSPAALDAAKSMMKLAAAAATIRNNQIAMGGSLQLGHRGQTMPWNTSTTTTIMNNGQRMVPFTPNFNQILPSPPKQQNAQLPSIEEDKNGAEDRSAGNQHIPVEANKNGGGGGGIPEQLINNGGNEQTRKQTAPVNEEQQSQAAKQQPLQQIPHPAAKNIHPLHDTPQSTLLPNLPVPQPMSLNKTTSVQTATTQAATASATPATMIVPQDDCTWFGHSIAAQLRMMSPQLKELTKMRLQKAIYECNSQSSTIPTPITKHVAHQQPNLASAAAEKKKDGAVIAMNGVGLGESGKDQAKQNPMKNGPNALNGMATQP